MNIPRLNEIGRTRLYTEQFLGLDRRPRTYDGAFDAMGNMSGEPWPLIATRKKRGLVAELDAPQGMCSLGKLAWVAGGTLYFDGEPTAITGLSAGEKQLATIGAYIVVFPDGVYYNTVDPADRGVIDREWQSSGNVSFTLCDMDGVEYPRNKITVSDTAPEEPSDGDYWINTSQSVHTMYRYSDMYEDWYGMSSVYVKISAAGIGAGLSVQDGVNISGIAYTGQDEALKKQLEMLNQASVAQAVDDDFIVVIGLIDANWTQTTGTIRADRKMPKMDYVIECNNRLWGCRYGVGDDGEFYNMIYASALGDFKNWQKYMGTSQDSYYVAVGSEGPFTGAAVHRGSPWFFKMNCVHRIYGEVPSNFTVQVSLCDGVIPGAHKTLIPYNGALYYLSPTGPMYFESLPDNFGQALDRRLIGGAAGQCGGKYYLSAQDEEGTWSLYVFDTQRRTWHREDESHALAFTALEGEMYMLLENGLLYALNGTAGEEEPEDIQWYMETAPMGYEYPDHKYLSRFLIRVELRGEMRAYVQYDGQGPWHPKGYIEGVGTVRSFLFPISPRRCESMKLRLVGKGEIKLYSIARELAMGRD